MGGQDRELEQIARFKSMGTQPGRSVQFGQQFAQLFRARLPGESFGCRFAEARGRLKCSWRASMSHGKPLSFTNRLNLSLVETNIRSQGGRYECKEDPFCILIALPSHGPEGN